MFGSVCSQGEMGFMRRVSRWGSPGRHLDLEG